MKKTLTTFITVVMVFAFASSAWAQTINISKNIEDITCYETKLSTFTISATSTSGTLKYLWKVDKNDGKGFVNAGSALNTFRFTPTLLMKGYKYKCVLSNTAETLDSAIAAIDVKAIAKITTQPKAPVKLFNGQNATLTINATGTDLLYQWEAYRNGVWTAIPDATSPSYTIANVPNEINGVRYRCIVSNGGSVATSSTVTMLVNKTVTLTKQPLSLIKETAETATFSVTATGASTITYQWYIADDETSDGTEIKAKTAPTLTISKLTKDYTNKYFYCIAKNGGGEVTSSRASLTVLQKTEVKPIATSMLLFRGGSNIISVNAKAEALIAYQWEYSTPDGKWHNATGDDAFGAMPADEAQISYAVSASSFVVGRKYRCKIWSGLVVGSKVLTSAPISLSLCDRTTVAFTPNTHLPQAFAKNEFGGLANQNYQAVLSVTAKGTSISYEWQSSSDNGATWGKVPAGSGITSSRYTSPILLSAADFDIKYRCAVKNTAGTEYSDIVVIKKLQPAKIAISPENVRCSNLSVASFTITPTADSGEPVKLTYLWQVSKDNGVTWLSAGSSSRTLNITRPSVTLSNNLYRCLVSNAANTNTTINKQQGRYPDASNAALLEVMAAATISTQPKALTTYDGGTARFEVKANGYRLNYQWQYSTNKGSIWSDFIGETDSVLNLSDISLPTGTLIRCQVWSSEVQSRTTASNTVSAAMTVKPALAITKLESKQGGVTTPCNGADTTIYYVDNAYPIQMSVGVTGTSPKYQWYTNSGLIKGATLSTYTISKPELTKAVDTDYWCVITNSMGERIESEKIKYEFWLCPMTPDLAGKSISFLPIAPTFPNLHIMTTGLSTCKVVINENALYFLNGLSYVYRRTSPTTADFSFTFRNEVNGEYRFGGKLVFNAEHMQTGGFYKLEGNYSAPDGRGLLKANVAINHLGYAPSTLLGGVLEFYSLADAPELLTVSVMCVIPVNARDCFVYGWNFGSDVMQDPPDFECTTAKYTYSKKGPLISTMTLNFTYKNKTISIPDIAIDFENYDAETYTYGGLYRYAGSTAEFKKGAGQIVLYPNMYANQSSSQGIMFTNISSGDAINASTVSDK